MADSKLQVEKAQTLELTEGEADVWHLVYTDAVNRFPKIMAETLGKLQAKGIGVERERLRDTLYLLERCRAVPFAGGFTNRSLRLRGDPYSNSLDQAMDMGHISDVPDVVGLIRTFGFHQSTFSKYAIVDLFNTPNTWTANQTFNGGVTIDNLNGFLKATAGVVSAVAALSVSDISDFYVAVDSIVSRPHTHSTVDLVDLFNKVNTWKYTQIFLETIDFTDQSTSIQRDSAGVLRLVGYNKIIIESLGAASVGYYEGRTFVFEWPVGDASLDWSASNSLVFEVPDGTPRLTLTTTGVTVAGTLTIGSLNGWLKATSGVVSASVLVASDITDFNSKVTDVVLGVPLRPHTHKSTDIVDFTQAVNNLATNVALGVPLRPHKHRIEDIIGANSGTITSGSITDFVPAVTNVVLGIPNKVHTHQAKDIVGMDPLMARPSQAVVAGTAILVTDGQPITPVTMSGNVTMTAAPTIAAGRHGQIAYIINEDPTDNLVLTDLGVLGGSLLRLGANTRTLTPGATLMLVYDAVIVAWVEKNFNTLVTITPAITSFTVDVGLGASAAPVAEVANTGTHTPTFAWSYTGVPSAGTVDISAGEVSGSDYPATISTPFTSLTGPAFNKGTSVNATRVFTPSITVNGVVLTTPTVTLTYINRRYCGPNSQSTLLSSGQILALDGAGGTSELSNSATNTVGFSVTTASGEYIWYAYRNAAGVITYMSINGELAGVSSIGTLSHTNDSGFAETFTTYRSTNTNFGAVTVRFGTTYGASNFRNRIFMGPHTSADLSGEASPSAAILTLDDTADGESNTNATVPGTYTAIKIEAGEYLWFCHPDAIADLATIKDGTTGFAVAGSYRTNVSFTNAFGYTETYRCWRSDNQGIYPSGENIVVT